MFIVTTTNPETGDKFWLRGTTWAFSDERAQRFETEDAANAALSKSKKFNKPWAAKRAHIARVL